MLFACSIEQNFVFFSCSVKKMEKRRWDVQQFDAKRNIARISCEKKGTRITPSLLSFTRYKSVGSSFDESLHVGSTILVFASNNPCSQGMHV